MADLGMKGLEVYHSSNNKLESMKLREMASRHHLLPTGGSDFHGGNKPDISIGTGRGGLRVSSLLLDDIKRSRMDDLLITGGYTFGNRKIHYKIAKFYPCI